MPHLSTGTSFNEHHHKQGMTFFQLKTKSKQINLKHLLIYETVISRTNLAQGLYQGTRIIIPLNLVILQLLIHVCFSLSLSQRLYTSVLSLSHSSNNHTCAHTLTHTYTTSLLSTLSGTLKVCTLMDNTTFLSFSDFLLFLFLFSILVASMFCCLQGYMKAEHKSGRAYKSYQLVLQEPNSFEEEAKGLGKVKVEQMFPLT